MTRTQHPFSLLICCLLITFSLFACRSTKVVASDDFSLSQSRSACFGTCPTYSLSVNHLGVVKYQGDNNVKNIGTFTKTLSKSQMSKLITLMDESDFLEYDSVYDNPNITDIPSSVTSYQHKGKYHKVLSRIGAPKAFTELQKEIDTIIGEDGFTPVPSN